MALLKKVVAVTEPRACVNIGIKFARNMGVKSGERVQVFGTTDRIVIYPEDTQVCETCLEPAGKCTCAS